jgi:hypothetical protein
MNSLEANYSLSLDSTPTSSPPRTSCFRASSQQYRTSEEHPNAWSNLTVLAVERHEGDVTLDKSTRAEASQKRSVHLGDLNASSTAYDYQTALSVQMATKTSSAATMRLNLPINPQVGATSLTIDNTKLKSLERKDLTSFAAHVLVDTETLETWQKETRSVKPLIEKFEAWTKDQAKK